MCDPTSSFFGFMGVTSAIVFANLGAAYGTAKSGVGIMSMGVMRPDLIMRSIIPVPFVARTASVRNFARTATRSRVKFKSLQWTIKINE